MAQPIESRSEIKALQAEKLSAFSAVKLQHIKDGVAALLALIGRNGVFDEYTVHDISHINAMLESLDWLVPPNVQDALTPADWLLIVLSVYLHDLGMLVTRAEYEARDKSGFVAFRDQILFAGDKGKDYKAKIDTLRPDAAERFLYQEFVRERHADRIRAWVTGKAPEILGVTVDAMQQIDELLRPLSPQFRRDLALVCESHHRDDLHDFKKYKTSQPYGNSDPETANVHYAAILLRAADLLHITKDRTPSIVFKAISPTDPISQQEWAKQMAVTRVRPKLGLNKEGNPDPDAPKDNIEVHAYFTREDGFFGLTSYLKYAAAELRKCNEWCKAASQQLGSQYKFPWKGIDDSNIEAQGFIRETFAFQLDQDRILELLTGHTLYNDTDVVIRELVQNALDAVRLRVFREQQSQSSSTPGRVIVGWDPQHRVVTVQDNGTGMTQAIIEKHLLRVGSSYYQDPEFRKKNPDFSSISRFGIGVLSAFMVADTVEVTTIHPDEEKARQLSLRSVHGRYLVRLFEKDAPEVKDIGSSGTIVKLTLRPSAKITNVRTIAEHWVVIPGFEVVYRSGSDNVRIGFDSPRQALEQVLTRAGYIVNGNPSCATNRPPTKVEEVTRDGVTLAYALEWSDYFQEWNFLRFDEALDREAASLVGKAIGTCIEGVRVERVTPGYDSRPIVALANITGADAPKTNVARSGLERTREWSRAMQTLYEIYCDHISAEMSELRQSRGFSLTWAVQEARYLLMPLFNSGRGVRALVDFDGLLDAVRQLPIVLIEKDGKRDVTSISELAKSGAFWTTDSAFFRSAEALIREVPTSSSVTSVLAALGTETLEIPTEPIVCGVHPTDLVYEEAFATREVEEIRIYQSQRRVDFMGIEALG